MIIHVVQSGETIQSIADSYGVSVEILIRDNGLEHANDLVIGQSIVVVFPEITYTVKEGDRLIDIANANNVTVMQLLRNNPYLTDRGYLYPGETIVIKYPTKGNITTHGNTVPYINKDTLRKTLPYLTYLSVLNYTATKEGEIITYYDDTDIIRITKEYDVVPLMLLTTLTLQGKANIGIAYDLLINKDFQNRQIENILTILKTKGYSGINISFEYVNSSNIDLYEDYFSTITKELSDKGYLVFVTIIPPITNVDTGKSFDTIDYSNLNQLAQNMIFMNYEWATNINPPSPISSIHNIDLFVNYIIQYISPDKVIIGLATIGYDWELPYSAGLSSVTSMTPSNTIDLARTVGAIIQFDELSQTPFYQYSMIQNDHSIEHIVWFIDARSINALLDLIFKYKLNGTGIWNITIYNAQLWLIINSQFETKKVSQT